MKNIMVCMLLLSCTLNASSQITIERAAVFHIQDKTSVTLQGDLSAWSNVEGEGYLELAGTKTAHIHMNGFQISNLALKSPGTLESDVTIASNINLQAGHLDLNNHHMVLDEKAAIAGDEKNYIETTGVGTVKKIVTGPVSSYMIPVGTAATYMPLQISTGVNYQHGAVTVSARDGASEHKPLQATTYLKHHWIVQQQGNLNNLIATGYYRLTDIAGNPANVDALYWNGFAWKSQLNDKKNDGKVSAQITSPAGELYAMNGIINNTKTGITLLSNPARSYVILQITSPFNNSYHVVLRDVTGRPLQETDLKVLAGVNQHSVYLNRLTAGAYVIDISSRTEKQSLKFLKIQ